MTSYISHTLFRRIAIYFGELDPTGSFSLTYVTEGAANTIWLVHFHDSNLSRHDSEIVLRMRKDVPSTSMAELKVQYEEQIAPLFAFNASLLLPVQLVEIDQQLIDILNSQLIAAEGSVRPPLRAGVYHPKFEVEPYAMVMANLAHGTAKVVEFKPKWLVQSPSAPRNAQRCRTCALNTMRRALGTSGRGDSGFCPFDLLSSNRHILSNALNRIWTDKGTLSQFVDVFTERVQPAMRELQQIQRQKGGVGLSDFLNPEDKDFGVAMALRDCSIMLQVGTRDGHLTVSMVKFLDLDLKEANPIKLERWADIEQELISGGWYTAKGEIECAMTFQ